jgi:3-oxoacyl-[acyl-carrier-protein] synthase III
MALYLTGIGHYHPQNRIPNGFFESLDIDTNDDWITERTGIRERRSVLNIETISAIRHGKTTVAALRKDGAIEPIETGAIPAWSIARERARIPHDQIEFANIICGTSIPDWSIPANACVIAAKLGINGTCFDVNSACSSFVVNLHVLQNLASTSGQRHLIVNPERYSLAINFSDRASCVLFGDGTALAVLESSDQDVSGSLRLIDTVIHSDPSGYEAVTVATNECFQQNGRVVQKFAVSKTVAITQELLSRNNMTVSDLTYFTGHQANLRMLESAVDKLGLPQERHIHNIETYGNQGAAGAPTVISMNWERFKSGDYVAVAVVGSGLTWGAALFQRV